MCQMKSKKKGRHRCPVRGSQNSVSVIKLERKNEYTDNSVFQIFMVSDWRTCVGNVKHRQEKLMLMPDFTIIGSIEEII